MPEAPNFRGGAGEGAPQASYWRDSGSSNLTIKGPSISKKGDSPDFCVGLGAQVRGWVDGGEIDCSIAVRVGVVATHTHRRNTIYTDATPHVHVTETDTHRGTHNAQANASTYMCVTCTGTCIHACTHRNT